MTIISSPSKNLVNILFLKNFTTPAFKRKAASVGRYRYEYTTIPALQAGWLQVAVPTMLLFRNTVFSACLFMYCVPKNTKTWCIIIGGSALRSKSKL